MATNYKEYYQTIVEKIQTYKDIVYFKPMTEEEIQFLETKTGFAIKPMYREFLSTIGIIQDVFPYLNNFSIDGILNDYNYTKDALPGYLPIECGDSLEETFLLINNKKIEDENIYFASFNDNREIIKFKKKGHFIKKIEESLLNLKKHSSDRCPNSEKINNTEFELKLIDFPRFLSLFKFVGIKQLTKWSPEYYPENLFDNEVAKFKFYDETIIIKRNIPDEEDVDDFDEEDDYDDSNFSFELEEPILTKKEDSIIYKTKTILDNSNLKYEAIDIYLIELE